MQWRNRRFRSSPVTPVKAHTGIERETAVVVAAAHGLDLGLVQQVAPDEESGDQFAEGYLQSCQTFRSEARFLKTQALGILSDRH